MWRGFVNGAPVALEHTEVRARYGQDPVPYETLWAIDKPGVRLACLPEVARERKWPDVVALFAEAEKSRREG